MAVKIRLRRMGAKKRPFYRIVVADSRTPRDGRFIDQIGHYDPTTNPPKMKIDGEKASLWLSRGAKPTDVVASLLKKASLEGAAPAVVEKKEEPAVAVVEAAPVVEAARVVEEVAAPKKRAARTRKVAEAAEPKKAATRARKKAEPAEPKKPATRMRKKAEPAAEQPSEERPAEEKPAEAQPTEAQE